ncbi:nucleoside-diphosphate kinase [Paraliobacillus sp. X-1268]|uniref:nucleoside-diphosphate kinase n=1 Tax=Paraliobacillus sp. X-1268 TaxID=2213193 RepID=UPI000E3DB12E|nr:nucleoside-diphosphate kinase [Paraliobacillus sp. X-1268]
MSKEYGMIMLKPDGVKIGLLDILLNKAKEERLDLVNIRKFQLTQQQVMDNFTTNINMDEYAKYMSSGKISVLLFYGENAGHKLRLIKFNLRQKYRCNSNDMENLIHNSDPGTEYRKQFNLFFNDLSILKFSSYADMYVHGDSNDDNNFLLLEHLENNSSLSWVGLVFNNFTYVRSVKLFELQYRRLNVLLGFYKSFSCFNRLVGLIGYLPASHKKFPEEFNDLEDYTIDGFISYINELGGVVILDYLQSEHMDLNFIFQMKHKGLTGVHLFDSRRSLEEVEEIEDIVENEVGLRFSGGSSGGVLPGELSIGKYEFETIYKKLVDCSYHRVDK